MLYDCIIVGAGPAGLAAAIYLARQKLKFLIISGNVGGQTLWSSDVENYLGFHLLDGVSLVEKFRKHLEDYKDGFELLEGQMVDSIHKKGEIFEVVTRNTSYETKTVLVATGAKHRELDVPGEKDLYGKGVSYCATCDAPLFRDKQVHVVGGGNSAMDAALSLVNYSKHVTLLLKDVDLQGDQAMIQKCKASAAIRIIGQARVLRIMGVRNVEGIVYADVHGQEVHESTQGVFIEIGLRPVSGFVQVSKDLHEQIVVDKHNATSVSGIWAAGDVTDIVHKQIAVAVGEGTKAALSVIGYLQRI